MPETPLSSLVSVCQSLASTRKRLEKREMISSFLKNLEPEEIGPAVLLIVGRIFPETESKALNIGYRTIQKAYGKTKQAILTEEPLTILSLQKVFKDIQNITGKDSVRKKTHMLEALIGRANESEQEIILKNIYGEMQHGVSEGVMLDSIADASNADPEVVRRANMLTGDMANVATIALTKGEESLKKIGLNLFTPVKPMLAELAEDFEDVFKYHEGKSSLEFKFDGARIQIHKKRDEIRIFSRRLSDVTGSLPDITALAGGFNADELLVDGEVVAVDKSGRPLPFQDLMRRFRRVHDVEELVKEIPLKLYLFDLLYLDGELLIDLPYEERRNRLSEVCQEELLANRVTTDKTEEAESFLKEAIEKGHEGLMAKSLSSDYAPGKRGKKWFKIKPADYLDVVIIAADWGYGRREGWLSNYHLAVKDVETDEYHMIGKTFKGLTDKEFEWMTARLQELKTRESEYTVYVRPEIVVEVAYNEIQKSPKYESGFALRFARIKRIREDKSARDVDSIVRVNELYQKQFEKKGVLG
ncbi:MAG: ATP-dependent DNA ligase [Methanobacteriota archaeon]|nr:MAG: ATP-dependent DNA ligase [Euryarchaeota archaeon]